jgi:hypothetical protein
MFRKRKRKQSDHVSVHDGVTVDEDFSETDGKKNKKSKKRRRKEKTHKDKAEERDTATSIATVGEPSAVQLSEPSVVPENVAHTSTAEPLPSVDQSLERKKPKKESKKKKTVSKEGSDSLAREETLQAVKKEKP